MHKIAIFGATGMLANPVIEEMIKNNFEIQALVRDIQKAQNKLPSSIHLIQGDLANLESIHRTLSYADYIYLNLSVAQASKKNDFQPEREGIAKVLQIARTYPIKGIAYLSSLVQRYQGMNGFDWWAFEIKQKAIEAIKASGIPYLIFYPSTFMENFDKGHYSRGNMIGLAGKSNYPMYFIAGEDYGKQVSKAFEIFDGNSQEYFIQGPESMIADEAAKVFAKYYKSKKLRIAKIPLGVLNFLGNFSPTFNYGAKIVSALNNYPETFEAQNTWELLGIPQITLKEYAEKA